MDRRWHPAIGLLAFLLYQGLSATAGAAARSPWAIGILCTLAGSIVPDVCEPAHTSRHRGFFHSRGLLAAVLFLFLFLALAAATPRPFPLAAAYPASWFLPGYLSHLLADATTPAGLPR